MKYYLSVLLLFVLATLNAQGTKEISVEDIFSKNVFRQDYVPGFRSMQDGHYYSEIREGKLLKVRFQDGQVEQEMLALDKLEFGGKKLQVEDYDFDAQERKLLLLCEGENIYRRSVLHRVYVYDLEKENIIRVSDSKILHPSFSPLGNKVAYVEGNNMHVLDLESGEKEDITDDGSFNIINGNCDWVYEEEFSFTKAYEWGNDGSYLAYYRFDQTQVPEYNFAVYDHLYPTDYRYKYPKAGEPNSLIDIRIYHFGSGKTINCKLNVDKDSYIPRLKINPFNNQVVLYHLNRLQNDLTMYAVNPKNGNSSAVFEETDTAYIEINDQIQFLHKRNAFVFASGKSGYMHLYLRDIDNNETIQITRGNWEVVSLFGVDEENQKIYFTSTEASPLERNLMSISMNGENKTNLTPDKGWHDISFSNGFTYFMDKYSTLQTPAVFCIKNQKGELIRTLKENATLKETMKQYDLSPIEFIQINNASDVSLNGYMIKPAHFSADKKYPVLMFQYSGPGSQQVMNQFAPQNFWWHQMLSQKGYIIVCVDGTGTGFRGEAFCKKTYRQLGKYESDDQIAVAQYLAQQPYVDAKRIGIWGWSYGGFMSSTCILKGADVFKAAIAVAPVTNWRYYDNIYTERYMRTPQENPKGYDDNSPVNMVDKLKGNFLLIHGTADDNVHLQNSTMMLDAMIKANKDYDSEFYPNKNHGIGGGNTRLHLYRRMTNFILEKL